jgi:hypothetical protein
MKYGRCFQHVIDMKLPFSMHEVTTMYGFYNFNFENWKDIGLTLGGLNRRSLWQSKLRMSNRRGWRKGRVIMSSSPQISTPIVVPPIIASYIQPRVKLPVDRQSINHKFTVDKTRCYLIVGMYPDGKPGEIFLKVDKVGSLEHGMADAFSCLFSMALQYGIPLKVMVDKFKHLHFAPAGITDSQVKDLRFADSIIDYVVRWMEMKFLNGNGHAGQSHTTHLVDVCPHGKAVNDTRYPGLSGNCSICRGQLP